MGRLTINDNRVINKRLISTLVSGEVFFDGDDFYILTDNDNDWLGVNLATGITTSFYGSDLVLPVKATLTIE